ncbi:cysteine hydrolase family protein [Falsirhodobacter sp. 1013]|uniref:cysteine hydrolase family protein n=1 Tax=Falsirhodobacter sp. 1013 TaxID=3417566 RepID=UPI003EB9EB14
MGNRAVVVVDVQNDYFPGGLYTLDGIAEASANVGKVLEAARARGERVIHIRHIFPDAGAPFFRPDSEGNEIHPSAAPQEGETVIVKNFPNSFQKTDLKEVLDADGIKDVVVVGAMSHMCIDATVRASSDFGFKTTVVQDACATRAQEFGGVTVPASQVHATMMAALAFAYADVIDTDAFLKG